MQKDTAFRGRRDHAAWVEQVWRNSTIIASMLDFAILSPTYDADR
jgi:hypothetical protein